METPLMEQRPGAEKMQLSEPSGMEDGRRACASNMTAVCLEHGHTQNTAETHTRQTLEAKLGVQASFPNAILSSLPHPLPILLFLSDVSLPEVAIKRFFFARMRLPPRSLEKSSPVPFSTGFLNLSISGQIILSWGFRHPVHDRMSLASIH